MREGGHKADKSTGAAHLCSSVVMVMVMMVMVIDCVCVCVCVCMCVCVNIYHHNNISTLISKYHKENFKKSKKNKIK